MKTIIGSGYPADYRRIGIGIVCRHFDPTPDEMWHDIQQLSRKMPNLDGELAIVQIGVQIMAIYQQFSEALGYLNTTEYAYASAIIRDVQEMFKVGFQRLFEKNHALERACVLYNVRGKDLADVMREEGELMKSMTLLSDIGAFSRDCRLLNLSVSRAIDTEVLQQVGIMADETTKDIVRQKIQENNRDSVDMSPVGYADFVEVRKVYDTWERQVGLIEATDSALQ